MLQQVSGGKGCSNFEGLLIPSLRLPQKDAAISSFINSLFSYSMRAKLINPIEFLLLLTVKCIKNRL